MPSELTQGVQNAIQSFIQMKTSDDHGHVAIDILRSIRDEATLMMECQNICDTFDSDPLRLYEDDDQNFIRQQVDRLKKLMKVISSSRSVTKDQTLIEIVVELSKDSIMKNVNESLRLTFSFQRSPIPKARTGMDHEKQEQQQQQQQPRKRKRSDSSVMGDDCGTSVSYHIDLSKDYMQKERLIDIQIMAPGTSPSIKAAEPIEELMVEEFDQNGNPVVIEEDNCGDGDDDDDDDDDDDGMNNNTNCDETDKFAAYCDPEGLENFLKWTGLDLDAQNAIFLLMSFPHYEHEWDLFGFLLESVFGGEDDESMETIDDDDDDDDK